MSCSRSGPCSMPSRVDLGDDERADARVGRTARARSTRSSPVAVGPAVDRDVAAARVEPDRDLARDASARARRRARGARPPRCRRRRARRRLPASVDSRPRTSRTPPPLCTLHATAAQIASIAAQVRVAAARRAASRSTTWIQRAPGRFEAARDRDRIVAVARLARRSRPAAGARHGRRAGRSTG